MGSIGIGVDVETGVRGDGGDGGEMALMPLLSLVLGENDPIRVLNRGVRIRGEGRVVVAEGLRVVNGTNVIEAEGRV